MPPLRVQTQRSTCLCLSASGVHCEFWARGRWISVCLSSAWSTLSVLGQSRVHSALFQNKPTNKQANKRSVVKGAGYCYRGPTFKFQYQHDSSQPSVMTVLGDCALSCPLLVLHSCGACAHSDPQVHIDI